MTPSEPGAGPVAAPGSAPPAPLGLTPVTIGALTAYGIASLVHLWAQLTDGDALANVTQWLAVPCLLVALVAATGLRSRLARWSAGGLVWSWVGDSLPDFVPDGSTFIVLMLSFLVAHVLFIVAFWPMRRESLLHRPIAWLYAGVAAVLVALCAPEAGPLTIGIIVYAGALAVMSLLAFGVDRLAGAGGILFLVSDGLLAIGEFVPAVEVPESGFLVMLTYLGALLLITLGVLRRDASRA